MSRIARIKAEGEAFYHIVSRIANKAFLLNNDEKKEHLGLDLWKCVIFRRLVCLLLFIC